MNARTRRTKPKPPYKSKFEESIANWFNKNEIEFKYETISFDYYQSSRRRGICHTCGDSNVSLIATYTPDFILPNGIIIEAKGKLDGKAKTKILDVLLSANNPLTVKNFRLLLQYDGWSGKGKQMRHSRWCELNDIPYSVFPKIPNDWYHP